MLGNVATMTLKNPTFDSPKVAKARLPFPILSKSDACGDSFFVRSGDILDDRLVSFLTIAGNAFIG